MATITIQVNDTSTGSVGLSNVYIVLYDVSANTSTQKQTDSTGSVVFSGLIAGNYKVYNTGIDTTGQNPPTECGFPTGFTGTLTPRRIDTTLTSSDTKTVTFKYDKPVPWSVTNGGNPPNVGITTGGGINLATGAAVAIPSINNNGMGYGLADNMIYGQIVTTRSDGAGGTATLELPLTYSGATLIGDCDINSYFYTPSGNNLTCIDVNPYRTTYLRPVNPYNNFQEILTSPYSTPFTPAPILYDAIDWSYVESVKGLVAGISTSANLWILSLTTPNAYNVPVIGTPPPLAGIAFSDVKNHYMPSGSNIIRFRMSTTVAIGSVLSSSSMSAFGDGCRALTAPVFYATPSVFKKVDRAITSPADTITYTVTIVNTGIVTGTNAFFQDTLPNGLTLVDNSIYVNNVQQIGATLNTLNIGTLPIGQIFTVTFNALVISNTIPLFVNYGIAGTNYLDDATDLTFTTTIPSNEVSTRNIFPYVTTSKFVNKSFTSISDTITYTISIHNTGTNIAYQSVLLDTIPLGTSLLSNSITIDGLTVPVGSTLSPPGLSIGNIPGGAYSTVTFNVFVVSIPASSKVDNDAKFNYTFTDTTITVPFSTFTNTVTTAIIVNSLPSTKFVDKNFAKCGDALTYTIQINNTGNTTASNIILTDTLPQGTMYIPNSATLNGVTLPGSINIETTGISVGTVPIGGISTVSFKVNVIC